MEEDLLNQCLNRLPRLLTSVWTSVIGALIGMLLGVPGGLLLGLLEVATLICLEHLPQETFMFVLAGPLYNYIVILSSAVGIIAGLVSYSVVIKMEGEGAADEALALAGPVCLVAVTVTGATLGAIHFQRDTLNYYIGQVCGYAVAQLVALFVYTVFRYFPIGNPLLPVLRIYNINFISIMDVAVFAPFGFMIASFVHLLSNSLTVTIILSIFFHPVFMYLRVHPRRHFVIVPVSIMFFITEILLAVNPETAVKTPPSTVTIIAKLIPVFIYQLLMVHIGMSLFESRQMGGAIQICVAAAASGAVVWGAIIVALIVMGPAPLIGALMGVAGAVGVSLAAAGAAADCYGCRGRLGVAVGAAVGGFAASCFHSGLPGVFIGLCAAMISLVHYRTFITFCYELYHCVKNNIFCQVVLLLLFWTVVVFRDKILSVFTA